MKVREHSWLLGVQIFASDPVVAEYFCYGTEGRTRRRGCVLSLGIVGVAYSQNEQAPTQKLLCRGPPSQNRVTE